MKNFGRIRKIIGHKPIIFTNYHNNFLNVKKPAELNVPPV